MTLYRVLPYDSSAAADEKGGVLYVRGSTSGRIANPDLYRELYLAAEPEGAVAEVFARLPIWTQSDFVHADGNPYALGAYELPDDVAIFNLDDVDALKSIGVTRPTSVIRRNRKTTQAWARSIFALGSYAGAEWWSYYNPDWTSLGLWDISRLRAVGAPEVLSPAHPAVQSTAKAIVRQVKVARPSTSLG